MDIFISWAEDRSKKVAEAMKNWLNLVIQGIDPWMSSESIRAGARWLSEINKRLSTTKFGILCLTPEALRSTWLHFEAGALAKSIDDSTFVCPYLIDIPDPTSVPMPLGQFQSKRADRQGTFALMQTINSALGDQALTATQLEKTFTAFWPELEKVIKDLPKTEQPIKKRKPEDLLEEILSIVRGLAKERAYGIALTPDMVQWATQQVSWPIKVREQTLRKQLDQELRDQAGIRGLGDEPGTATSKE